MKRILNLPAILLLFVGAIFMTSCEEEPGGGGGGGTTGPSITLNSDAALTVAPEEAISIDFSAIQGDSPLNAFTVYQDGTKLSVDRLMIDGTTPGDAAVLLLGADKTSFSNKIATIIAQSEAASTVTFEIRVSDEANETSSIFVDVTTVGTPPIISATPPTEFTAMQGEKTTLKITATTGSGKLSSIEVQENGVAMDAARVFWKDSSTPVAANPFALSMEDEDGFTEGELFIVTPMMEGDFVYNVIVTDEFGLMHSVSYTISVAAAGTPVDLRTDVLLNSAGPAGTGGLDLDEGIGTGSSSSIAEIRDNGIDSDLPVADNWRQTISPVNGSNMKYVVAAANGVPEGFTFAGVEFKEDIAGLYTANTGEVIDETRSTSVVTVGDNFVVENSGKYWLLTVTAVDATADNNDDKYTFDVKF